MKVSLEWVRDYVDLPTGLDVKDLAHELTLKTVEVEELVDTAAAVANVVVARVAALESIDGGYRVVCDVGASARCRGTLHLGRLLELSSGRRRLGAPGIPAAHPKHPDHCS